VRALALAVVALALAPATAAAAPPPGAREEVPVHSTAPDANIVHESFVRVFDPLPRSAGAHPAACDWVTYLRFRHAKGPADATKADSVAVMMPGFLGGAAYFDQVARNAVRDAGAKGRYVEFWALDRRSNCLEDHAGVQAAAGRGDPQVAFDYYWGGKAVNGKRFAGFPNPTSVPFLKTFGLERTVRDWYAVIRAGFPDPAVRARKVICGGHSLGGPITTAFAGWDFDGNPATTADAGYRQCAGFAGMDTRFSLGLPGGGGGLDITRAFFGLSAVSGAPYMNATPLTPETFQVPPIFGVGAYYNPSGTNALGGLPHTVNLDLAQVLLFSRDVVNAVTGPGIRQFRLSNEVALGGIFDDNSAPLSFLRASVGFFRGGKIVDKNFPFPGDGTYALPGDTSTPLYEWENYDDVGASGHPLARNEEGGFYTSRESEVSDIHELARTMFQAPADFIEQYFPSALTEDVSAAGAGEIDDLRYNGTSQKPALLILAGDSQDNSAPDTGPPIVGAPPNAQPLSRRVTLPGYNHNDVNTAARTQNDGRPEPSADELSRFMLKVAGPAKIRLTVAPKRVRAGKRVRVRFRVAKIEGCTRGVTIRFAGKRVKTNRNGRASLRVKPRRSGRPKVTARKSGCRAASARVRVLRRR
jgi:hypothetical protein